MIRKESLGIAEIILTGGGSLNPSSIIQGLNNLSYGSLQYTNESWKEGVLCVTEDNEHSAILEATSTRLAEIIRATMDTIKDYGVPVAAKVIAGTKILYSPGELRNAANGSLHIQYTNVDDPFFNSDLFPTAVRDQVLTYTAIDLSVGEGLEFNYPSREQIETFMDSNHPDILEVMNNPEEDTLFVAEMIGNKHMLADMFVTNSENSFNFQKVKEVRVGRLLKLYTILTKMYHSDQPVPWLGKGDLKAYRAYVNLLWNGVTAYLLQLKNVITAYRRQKLVLVQERPVAFNGSNAIIMNSYKKAKILTGSVKVFYTNDMLESITRDNLGFQELIVGYYYGSLSGKNVDLMAAITNPVRMGELAKQYYADVHNTLLQDGYEGFIKDGLKAIHEFIQEHENVRERVLENSTKRGIVYDTWLTSNFRQELGAAFHQIAQRCPNDMAIIGEGDNPDGDRVDVLMETQLVPKFLRAIGCNLAADLITATFIQTTEDNVGDKRERMAVAVVDLIIDKCLG